jgi:Na+/H+ antiporter NhaD/arsenite permease-like protein
MFFNLDTTAVLLTPVMLALAPKARIAALPLAMTIATPWASLAILLCLESCRDHGLRVSLRKFVLTSLGLAVVALAVSVGALLSTR